MIDLTTPKDQLIEWFQMEFPELVQSMKDCSHHYDDQNLNAYHLESDIFTHTMMVYKQAENFSPNNKFVKFSALLHDIGKPMSMEIVEERKRKRFIGHEGVSAFMSADILNKTDLTTSEKIHIFKLISLHGNLFHHIKSDKTIKSDIVDVFKGEKTLLSDLTHQVRADSTGRFYKNTDENDSLFTSQLPDRFQHIINQLDDGVAEGDLSAPVLTVLVGPPCSEKSTARDRLVSENPNLVVISRDDLVEEFGKSKGMNYTETFRFLMDNKNIEKSEIADKFEKIKNDAKKANKSVLVDMTSMSKKSRRKWINEFPKHRAQCIVFVKGYNDLVKCAKKREEETGKGIPEKVILNMLKSFTLPLYSEGFTEINYEWIPPRF